MKEIERWSIYELILPHKIEKGNPFTVRVSALFTGPDGTQRVDGFYNGHGAYVIRYMPKEQGRYTVRVLSEISALHGKEDSFTAIPAGKGNHGPAVVKGTRFTYADGSPLFISGTTAYVWHHRPEEVREQTLESFTRYRFNKIRMLFFPKHYTGGYNAVNVSYEPPCYPFEGKPGFFDFYRPNSQYFEEFEDRLQELMERDIFADVILFHPYDFGHWSIDTGMDEDAALFYLKYIIARLASFRNVWWSLANEYDIKMLDTSRMVVGYDVRDWDVIGEFIKARDPSHLPISCHNIPFGRIYPDRPWMSHVSYQHPDTYTLLLELLETYQKPVINDEYQYEGNIIDEWGNSSPQTMLERHWRSLMAGGYATHGEAFIRDNNRDIFWSYGGEMIGESAPRIAYMHEIIKSVPLDEMSRDWLNSEGVNYYALSKGFDYYLVFMRYELKGKALWIGPYEETVRDNLRYHATYYDIWECKQIKEEILTGRITVPITEWTAVVLKRI